MTEPSSFMNEEKGEASAAAQPLSEAAAGPSTAAAAAPSSAAPAATQAKVSSVTANQLLLFCKHGFVTGAESASTPAVDDAEARHNVARWLQAAKGPKEPVDLKKLTVRQYLEATVVSVLLKGMQVM